MLEFPGITWTVWNEHFGGKVEEFYSHWTVATKNAIICGGHFWQENLRQSLEGKIVCGKQREKSEVTWGGQADKIL